MLQKLLRVFWNDKGPFLWVFFLVFLISYLVLMAIDFVPEPVSEVAPDEASAVLDEQITDDVIPAEFVEPAAATGPLLPSSISFPKLNRTVTILNPQSREVSDLDTALLSGVVRHPDSADLSMEGNVFILGHSSHLPNVFNKNFQAFNDIETLEWGDIIEVTAPGQVHVYQVDKVYKANAQDTTVPISGTGHRLTLATCNSFGSVDDRFIVEAKRVEIRTL